MLGDPTDATGGDDAENGDAAVEAHRLKRRRRNSCGIH